MKCSKRCSEWRTGSQLSIGEERSEILICKVLYITCALVLNSSSNKSGKGWLCLFCKCFLECADGCTFLCELCRHAASLTTVVSKLCIMAPPQFHHAPFLTSCMHALRTAFPVCIFKINFRFFSMNNIWK